MLRAGVIRRISSGAPSKKLPLPRSLLHRPRLKRVVCFTSRERTGYTKTNVAQAQHATNRPWEILEARPSQKHRAPPSAMASLFRGQPTDIPRNHGFPPNLDSLNHPSSQLFRIHSSSISPRTYPIDMQPHRSNIKRTSNPSQPPARSTPFLMMGLRSSRPSPPHRVFHPANLHG